MKQLFFLLSLLYFAHAFTNVTQVQFESCLNQNNCYYQTENLTIWANDSSISYVSFDLQPLNLPEPIVFTIT